MIMNMKNQELIQVRHELNPSLLSVQLASGLRGVMMVAMLLMLLGGFAQAQLTLDLAPEYYYWHEKDPQTGRKFLDESGFRMALEASYKQPKEQGWLWAVRAKVYYGSVDYNGGIQDPSGTMSPFKATTRYRGALAEARYGYRAKLGQQYVIDTMFGAGVDYWFRDLPSSSDPSILSYDEYFLPIYLKAGFDINPRVEKGWIASVGIKAPVYTKQWIKSDLGSVTLNPTMRLSGYAQAGYQFTRHMSAIAFIDSYWFGKSDKVDTGFAAIQQPESYTYSIGLKLGWTF